MVEWRLEQRIDQFCARCARAVLSSRFAIWSNTVPTILRGTFASGALTSRPSGAHAVCCAASDAGTTNIAVMIDGAIHLRRKSDSPYGSSRASGIIHIQHGTPAEPVVGCLRARERHERIECLAAGVAVVNRLAAREWSCIGPVRQKADESLGADPDRGAGEAEGPKAARVEQSEPRARKNSAEADFTKPSRKHHRRSMVADLARLASWSHSLLEESIVHRFVTLTR